MPASGTQDHGDAAVDDGEQTRGDFRVEEAAAKSTDLIWISRGFGVRSVHAGNWIGER